MRERDEECNGRGEKGRRDVAKEENVFMQLQSFLERQTLLLGEQDDQTVPRCSTDGGIRTHLAECFLSQHMSPVYSCPQGGTCLTEFVVGRPTWTPLRCELLSPRLTQKSGRVYIQTSPNGPHLRLFLT